MKTTGNDIPVILVNLFFSMFEDFLELNRNEKKIQNFNLFSRVYIYTYNRMVHCLVKFSKVLFFVFKSIFCFTYVSFLSIDKTQNRLDEDSYDPWPSLLTNKKKKKKKIYNFNSSMNSFIEYFCCKVFISNEWKNRTFLEILFFQEFSTSNAISYCQKNIFFSLQKT